jgi:transcriptional regulator GlxA family with amidase domain
MSIGVGNQIVDKAVAAALDALPQRLSTREMAAAAGVSLWSLQRAFERMSRQTPVAYVQQLCLERARCDLEQPKPGDTVFAVARRWGFSSPDGAFRDGYWAAYRERPSDTLKRARTPKPMSHTSVRDDHVVCLECGRKMRRLRRHLAVSHGLTADAYRQRWGLRNDAPLVCVKLSRQSAARARANGLAAHGTKARVARKKRNTFLHGKRINGDALPPAMLVARAEQLMLDALPIRLGEAFLSQVLGVGLRTLRRAFLDERGATPYLALRNRRLDEVKHRLEANHRSTPAAVAHECGFGHYARFQRDFIARFGRDPNEIRHSQSPTEPTAGKKNRHGIARPLRGHENQLLLTAI